MRSYTITAWKEPPFTASIQREAETAEEALAIGEKHDWSGEDFEDCGDWPDVSFIRAHHDGDDGATDEAEADLSDMALAHQAVSDEALRRLALRDAAAAALAQIKSMVGGRTAYGMELSNPDHPWHAIVGDLERAIAADVAPLPDAAPTVDPQPSAEEA